MDILYCDEVGQVSAECLSISDIIKNNQLKQYVFGRIVDDMYNLSHSDSTYKSKTILNINIYYHLF